jgi:LmbE family N-acetylglucosaminyl deacetylase
MTDGASLDLPVPARALAVGAHPDDIEFGCGGTLAKWATAGCAIHHLICTDGSKGSWDAEENLAALVETRKAEQRAAARELGGEADVIFLDWPDGELEEAKVVRSQIAWWVRKLLPDVVLGHDPWKRYRLHPDHRHAGFLTVDAVVAARDPHFFPEHGIEPHRPTTVLLWEADDPDHVEDITPTLNRKLAALLAHRSQFRSTMEIGEDDTGEQMDAFRRRITERAEEVGRAAGVAYGERFKAIREL